MIYSLREVASLPYTNERFKFLCDNKNLHKYIDDKTGIYWFRMDEIAKLLSYKSVNHACAHFCNNDFCTKIDRDRFGTTGYNGDLINEYGVFTLIQYSTNPEAKNLTRWLYNIGFPNAHRHGSRAPFSFKDFEGVQEGFVSFAPIANTAPKQQPIPQPQFIADDFDDESDSCAVVSVCGDKLISLENFRKLLNHFDLCFSYDKLCHILRNDGYIAEGINTPSKRAIDEGYMTEFTVVTNENLSFGVKISSRDIVPMVTIKGVLHFIEKYYNLI